MRDDFNALLESIEHNRSVVEHGKRFGIQLDTEPDNFESIAESHGFEIVERKYLGGYVEVWMRPHQS